MLEPIRLFFSRIPADPLIGAQSIRDTSGRKIPDDIRELMNQAEDRIGPLAWVSDDVFALPEHPRAERRV
ncbi:hypothetical protein WH216_15940 [Xanthomonas perforans]|uniref:hypothetical protein n=1 Tax=Xanthomonas perforans TaxID=442694 RepID=UPI003219FE91